MWWSDFTCIYQSYPSIYFSFVHCSILPTSFYCLIYVLPYSVLWYFACTYFILYIVSNDENKDVQSVYSRSVTMPGLDQNWSLLPTLRRFRRKLALANYGVKKTTTREYVLGRHWVDIGRAMSAQRRFDVGLMSPADVGPTSVRRQSQNLNIIIKTNRNVPQRNATIHFCPQRNRITTTDRSMMQVSETDVNKSSLLKAGRDAHKEAGGFVAQMK